MGFGRLFSIFVGFLISSSLLLGTTNWEALVTLLNDNVDNVVPIPIPTDLPGTLASAGNRPQGVAITPDRTTALVVNTGNNTVSVLDLTQPSPFPSYPVTVGARPIAVAITPDGSTALVSNSTDGTVSVLDLTVSPIGPGVAVPAGVVPNGIAITPDGTKAIVCDGYSNFVTILNVQPSVQPSYSVSVGGNTQYVAVTPDGTKALVSFVYTNEVAVLDLTQFPIQFSYTVPVGSGPLGIAITSDGTKALVANTGDETVSVLDLTQPIIEQGYDVPVGANPSHVAITPDGIRAYVTNTYSLNVSVLDVTKTPIVPIGSDIPLSSNPFGIAITPDQAPTSLFTSSVNGLTVSFDGSGSSSPVGGIKEYIWNFGDGTDPVTTTGPTVSHTYARSGEYTVSLTVVNDAGTSLDITFTGQTVSNRGLPRALLTQTVTLAIQAPLSFTGKVDLDKDEKQVVLKTEWQPSGDMNTWSYEIFARDEKIAVLIGNDGNCATITLHPRHFPKKITKKYRHYLEHKYAIRSVSTDGVASPLVPLRVDL
jgi:DNA-binding beta-propeller fold protein YncE